MRTLVLDTETSGLPNFRLPADDPSQPRMIQIAAKLYGPDRAAERSLVSLIRPDGWLMDDDLAAELGNGLFHARLVEEGRPAAEVLAEFAEMHDAADLVVAYGISFDLKTLRGELRRAGIADRYGERPTFCPMRAATPICKMPPTEAMLRANRRSPKTPKLAEAYEILLGKTLEGAHDALADLDATAELLWWLVDNGHGPKVEARGEAA